MVPHAADTQNQAGLIQDIHMAARKPAACKTEMLFLIALHIRAKQALSDSLPRYNRQRRAGASYVRPYSSCADIFISLIPSVDPDALANSSTTSAEERQFNAILYF